METPALIPRPERTLTGFLGYFDVVVLGLLVFVLISLYVLDMPEPTLWGWGFLIGVWALVPLDVVIARASNAIGLVRATVTLVFASLAGIMLFARIYENYGIQQSSILNDLDITGDFWLAIFFSIVTWTTLGYGDFKPSSDVRGFAAAEALFGYLVMAVLIGLIVSEFPRRDKPNSKIDGGGESVE